MERGSTTRAVPKTASAGNRGMWMEDTEVQQSSSQQRGGGRHEPSYMDIRSVRKSQIPTEHSGNRTDTGPSLTSESEIEKPAAPEDDNGSSSSSSLSPSSSASSRGPAGRRLGPGPRRGVRLMRSVSEVRDGIESRRDLDIEQAHPLEKQPTPRNLADENLVTWDDDDPDNPKAWSFGRKWAAVSIVSMFTLISPVSSSMTAPALNSIGAELHMTSQFEKELSLSIFVLGKPPFKSPSCAGP